jgi:hypothetical protein
MVVWRLQRFFLFGLVFIAWCSIEILEAMEEQDSDSHHQDYACAIDHSHEQRILLLAV